MMMKQRVISRLSPQLAKLGALLTLAACATKPTPVPSNPRAAPNQKSTDSAIPVAIIKAVQKIIPLKLSGISSIAPTNQGLLVLGTLPQEEPSYGYPRQPYEAIYQLEGNDLKLMDSKFCPREYRSAETIESNLEYYFFAIATSPLGIELFGKTLGDGSSRVVHARRTPDGKWLCDVGTRLEFVFGAHHYGWLRVADVLWADIPLSGLFRLTENGVVLPELPPEQSDRSYDVSFSIGDCDGHTAWAIAEDHLFEMAGLRWVDRTDTLPDGTAPKLVDIAALADGRACLVTGTGQVLLFDGTEWERLLVPEGIAPERVEPGQQGDFWFLEKHTLYRWKGGVWSKLVLSAELNPYHPITFERDGTLTFVVADKTQDLSQLLRVTLEVSP
jgi:hypothetical protein